ncbi:hypothetical protein SOVF_189910, partial [Spinacia oleracea]
MFMDEWDYWINRLQLVSPSNEN